MEKLREVVFKEPALEFEVWLKEWLTKKENTRIVLFEKYRKREDVRN